MRSHHRLLVSVPCSLLLVVAPGMVWAQSAAWPQFRGPGGQGVVRSQQLPMHWEEDAPSIRWKTPISGEGWSSPVIQNDTLWITTAADEGRSLRAVCVAADDGRVLREAEVFRITDPIHINPKNSYASPTPVLDGNCVYIHFGTMGTACLDADTGDVLWRNIELQLDHKEGPGSSPIVHGPHLIVHCDGIDVQYIVALDKATGEIAWKAVRPGPFSVPDPDQHKAYSTPLVIHVDGQDQLISTAADWVFAYDPATGDELWKVNYIGYSNVPRPVFDGRRIYICTGYNRPELWAIRVTDAAGDVTETHVDWRFRGQVPANSSPVLAAGRLFLVSDRGVATCVDPETGREIWKMRLGGNYSASPITDGQRIWFSSEDGEVHVIRAGDEYELLATNVLDGRLMASPAVVGDTLYLRTDSHLYRIENPATDEMVQR